VSPIAATNDFVVKFANINGSGSASANQLFARAVLRMGVPVSPRNIFPSNIQGLPTWYEVRISEAGWLGRRGGYDLLVAMNPQTWDADVEGLAPGGYVLYDNSKPLPQSKLRDDVTVIGVPLTQLCNRAYDEPRQRQLFKNVMYLGVLAVLLGIERDAIVELIGEQFKGKTTLQEPNVRALDMGREYAEENLTPIGLRVARRDEIGERIFVEGNEAAALGLVYGGATVAAWYPITPSSSLAEAFQKHCAKWRVDPETGKHRYAIVQAEDEIASIGIATGAGWNGARAFTATSGPGISLMNEIIGLAYFAEIPVTIVDVQRGGPSTGMPTRTQQADIMACAHASHGDTRHVLVFPADPHECFEFAALSLDLADRLQTPVFMLSDLDIGMNQRLCAPFQWNEGRHYDRGKVLTEAQLEAGAAFGRYRDVDGDGIPYRTYPGTHPTRGSYFTRGTSKDADARYSEKGADYVENVQRLERKLEAAKSLLPQPVLHEARHPARHGAIYFGSTSSAMAEAIAKLETDGLHIDTLRLRGYPFADSVKEFIDEHETVFVVEQNRDAQLRTLLIEQFEIDPARLIPVLHFDGAPITARFIARTIGEKMHQTKTARQRDNEVA
jgi:2-oxoglutarate ferredoxin oxidoreductase subunit alpha